MSDRRDDILDYLDGEMDETRQADLHDWLNRAPERWDQLAELSFIHSAIGEQLRKEESAALFHFDLLHSLPDLEAQDKEVTMKEVGSAMRYVLKHTFTPKRLVTIGSIAAAVALAVTLFLVMQGESDDPTPGLTGVPDEIQPQVHAPATLTATDDAQWSGPIAAVGNDLQAGQRFTLSAGFAEVTTADGAVAILEAPCAFELVDHNAIRLHEGKMVGICETPTSRGFTVWTDNAKIVDLGTVFGVEHIGGITHTTVFEGEVTLTTVNGNNDNATPAYLQLGESASVDADRRIELDAPESPTRFVRNWETLSEPELTGEIVYERSMPKSLVQDAHENELVVLFLERAGLRLTADLRADMTEPGVYERFDETGSAVPKGTRVDSYLVHFDFKRAGGDPHAPKNATIRFDRPILGVIADETSLWASDRQLALAGVDYGQPTPGKTTGRGLERKLALPGDVVEISDDRRTLTFKVYGSMAIDQMRVLVQSKESNTPRTP